MQGMRSTSMWKSPPSQIAKRGYFGTTLSDVRRIRNRLDPGVKPHPDYVDFTPRLGNDVQVNLTFAFAGFDLSESRAYRNLHHEGLIQRSNIKKDPKKAIRIENKKKDDDTQFFNVQKSANPSQNILSQNQFSDILKQVKKSFKNERDLFLHEGAVGATTNAHLPLRVFADNAQVALWCRKMLPRVKLDEPVHQEYEGIAYVASTFTPTEDVKKNSLVAHSTKELIWNPKRAEEHEITNNQGPFDTITKNLQLVVVAGTDSSAVLRESLALAAARGTKDTTAVALNADSIINGKDTALVFSSNNHFLKTIKPTNLLGGHNVFWTLQGLVPFWNGVTLPYSEGLQLNKGDVVEKLPNGEERVTIGLNSPNVSSAPKNIVFMVQDTEQKLPTVSKLNAQQAVKFLLGGYNGKQFSPFYGQQLSSDNKTFSQNLQTLIESSKANVFVINSGGKKDEDVKNLFNSVLTNGANAKTGNAVGDILTPISNLTGYSGTLSEGKSSSAFNQELTDFLKKTYPA